MDLSHDLEVIECPLCHAGVKTAQMTEYNDQDKKFWGHNYDTRERVCEDGAWLHFRVNDEDRLAFVPSKST